MKNFQRLQFGLTVSCAGMAKQLLVLFFLSAICYSSIAQSTNYRAQGNYYSAKTKLKAGAYQEAIDYVNKSKTALGGTNEELQYLHILAAYNLEDFEQAQKELQTFFDIGEKKVKPVYFDKTVDRLTNDETRELTMLMDPIFEKADKKKNHRCKKCNGTGTASVIKTTYEHCNKCGEEDRGRTLIVSGSTRRGYQRTEWKGYTSTACESCAGVGQTVCSKCDGLGDNCKGCNRHPTNPSGMKGRSFFCSPCDGYGLNFNLCTACKGTKSCEKKSTAKVVCPDCNGKGW
jgi:hypothetical protein